MCTQPVLSSCSKVAPSFDHLVGAGDEGGRHVEAERPGGLEVNHSYFVGACTGKFTLAPDQRAA